MAGTPETILPRTTNSGPRSVPRRAAFDDLRVGQVVVFTDDDDKQSVYGGKVSQVGDTRAVAGGWFIHPGDTTITILCDAPAEPVKVRRDLLCVARGLVKSHHEVRASGALYDSATERWVDMLADELALIDNAETGDTP